MARGATPGPAWRRSGAWPILHLFVVVVLGCSRKYSQFLLFFFARRPPLRGPKAIQLLHKPPPRPRATGCGVSRLLLVVVARRRSPKKKNFQTKGPHRNTCKKHTPAGAVGSRGQIAARRKAAGRAIAGVGGQGARAGQAHRTSPRAPHRHSGHDHRSAHGLAGDGPGRGRPSVVARCRPEMSRVREHGSSRASGYHRAIIARVIAAAAHGRRDSRRRSRHRRRHRRQAARRRRRWRQLGGGSRRRRPRRRSRSRC